MFSSEVEIRVRYGETDRMGYVYYGNYAQYFEEGDDEISIEKDYTSANTVQLNIKEMVNTLLKLEFIQQQLKG